MQIFVLKMKEKVSIQLQCVFFEAKNEKKIASKEKPIGVIVLNLPKQMRGPFPNGKNIPLLFSSLEAIDSKRSGLKEFGSS